MRLYSAELKNQSKMAQHIVQQEFCRVLQDSVIADLIQVENLINYAPYLKQLKGGGVF